MALCAVLHAGVCRGVQEVVMALREPAEGAWPVWKQSNISAEVVAVV